MTLKSLASLVTNKPTVIKEVATVTTTVLSQFQLKSQLAVYLSIALVAVPWQLIKGKDFYNKSQTSVAIVWVASFVLNLITLNLPGRFDNSNSSPEGGPWKSLFAPAPYAFAIWGVIYLTEFLLTAFIATNYREKVIKTLTMITPFWLSTNIYQSLWCLTFRPQFKEYLWVPATFLGLGATSLLTAVALVSKNLLIADTNDSFYYLLLLRIPLSLHTGWLAAATLLNLNGFVAFNKIPMSSQLAVAFASVFVAFLIGTVSTFLLKDPLLAGTVAWATAALAYQTYNKCYVEIAPVAIDALALTESVLYKILLIVAIISPFVPTIFK